MGALTKFLTFLTIAAFIAFVTTIVILIKNRKQIKIAKKPVINYLCKFNKNHKYGNLISKKPIGKNKELLQITYSIKEPDEDGEFVIGYQQIIAHSKFVIETEQELKILPKDPSELGHDEFKKELVDFMNKQNDLKDMADAQNQQKERFMKLYKETLGGELSELILKQATALKPEETKKETETKKDKSK